MTPHLAHRKDIYQFPNPFRVLLYGVDTSAEAARACLTTANDLQYVVLQVKLTDEMAQDWRMVSADFTAIDQNESWVLYERTGHSVQCVYGQWYDVFQLRPPDQFPHLTTASG